MSSTIIHILALALSLYSVLGKHEQLPLKPSDLAKIDPGSLPNVPARRLRGIHNRRLRMLINTYEHYRRQDVNYLHEAGLLTTTEPTKQFESYEPYEYESDPMVTYEYDEYEKEPGEPYEPEEYGTDPTEPYERNERYESDDTSESSSDEGLFEIEEEEKDEEITREEGEFRIEQHDDHEHIYGLKDKDGNEYVLIGTMEDGYVLVDMENNQLAVFFQAYFEMSELDWESVEYLGNYPSEDGSYTVDAFLVEDIHGKQYYFIGNPEMGYVLSDTEGNPVVVYYPAFFGVNW